MDWTRFGFEWLPLEAQELTSQLIEIEGYRNAAQNLVLPADWSRQLNELNRVRAVRGTTALEGNPLSEEAVGEQLRQQDELPAAPEPKRQEERQVRNTGAAQEWVRTRFSPGSRPLNASDILEMHRLLTAGSDETNNTPGRLRSHPVRVGTEELGGVHRGAPEAELPHLLEDFAAFVGSRKLRAQHPVVRALLAHFFLVTIHPFGDGNGRVSRLVEAGILFQGEYNVHGFYGLSNYFYRHGDRYMRLLQQSRRCQPFDLGAFVSFGVQGFRDELKGINNFVKAKLNRALYRDALNRARRKRIGPRRHALNDREYDLLTYLVETTEPSDPFAEEPSRRVKFVELLSDSRVQAVYRKVKERTFRRELVRLLREGFLSTEAVGSFEEWVVEVDFDAIGKY